MPYRFGTLAPLFGCTVGIAVLQRSGLHSQQRVANRVNLLPGKVHHSLPRKGQHGYAVGTILIIAFRTAGT